VLRIPPDLHAVLRRAAKGAGLSLNDYCARKLAAPLGNLTAFPGAVEVVERAALLFGEELIGIAAFGSWARGELAETSDIDVVVVVGQDVKLTRALYRRWDEAPVFWSRRTVEPHFTHLPAADEKAGGLWAEMAVDGVVLFETGLQLSERLVAVRHDIAAGRLVRRFVHGQPYWKEVA